MRIFIELLILLGTISFFSGCIDDQTTGPHVEISEIFINMEDTLYFAMPNEKFVLDGSKMVVQTDSSLPLEFTWRGGLEIPTSAGSGVTVDSLRMLSNEPVLECSFKDFGTYRMRLKVTNGQMADFKYFRVVVGSKFDEGLVVLSKNEAGEGMFSILNSELAADKLLEKTEKDFFYVTDDDTPMLKEDILDFNLCAGRAYYIPRENYFYLLTRQSGAYYLDQYSLHPLGDPIQFSKPAILLSLHYHNPTFDLFAYTEDGDVISHCLKYNMEVPRVAFESIHHWDRAKIIKMKIDPTWAKAAYRDVLLLMDDKTSTLYGMMLDEANNQKQSWWGPVHFDGYEIITLGCYYANWCYNIALLCRSLENPAVYKKFTYTWCYYGSNWFGLENKKPTFGEKEMDDPGIAWDSKLLDCRTKGCMIYLYKNMLTCWYPGDTQFPLGANYPSGQWLFDIRQHGYSGNTEVIDMDIDIAHKYIYLAVYDPNDSNEMKGSIVVVNATDFKLIKEYKNVCNRPMKIFYKPSKNRTSYEEPYC